MNVRSLLPIVITASVAMAPNLSHAHFLWVTLDPATKKVAVTFQEFPGNDPLPLGDRSAQVRAWTDTEKSLSLTSDGSQLVSQSGASAVGVSLDYGVIDRRDQGRGVFWLQYFAKAAASAKSSQTKLALPVELLLAEGADGKPIVTVLHDGKPAADAEVVVDQPGGLPAFEGKTGSDGTLQLPVGGGFRVVRALVTDDAKGTHAGKDYDLVRSYGTLTIGTLTTPNARPLTQQLHEAFGNNHEVVSHTALIETLMGGKLTKPQLEAHFQQRALVHEAVDQILSVAPVAQPVPYGVDQAKVLSLLKSDMSSSDIAWPTDAKAWTLTKDLLQQIRESAKQGPYFALGVFHVYYGGITHGGRDIGKIIADTLGVLETYYLQSDGYADYARRVNEIKDPAAQREMIRGGVAAYRYIIASDNDPIFKTK